MKKACDYCFVLNYKSADKAHHVTGPDGKNAYFVNKAKECYLLYPDKKIKLLPGQAIFHPFGGSVFLNLDHGAVVEKYEMPEFLIDNLKTTSSASLI